MGYWKNILPKGLYNKLENTRKNLIGKPQLTYSGEGEDLIIERLVKHLSKGTYVDIGCYHPKVGSNTFKLFKKGRGSRKMKGGMAFGGPLSPQSYSGEGTGTSGVNLQFVAGNAA